MKKAGLVILILGVIITVFTGFKFVTREKIVDVGSVQISKNKNHSLAWSPVMGLVVMAAGGAIFVLGSRKA